MNSLNSTVKPIINNTLTQTFPNRNFSVSGGKIFNEMLYPFQNTLLAKLNPFLERIYLPKNRFISKSGDDSLFLYFPETAVISELEMLEDGKMMETGMIGWEGIVNPFAIFGSSKTIRWAQVSAPGNVIKIKADIFRDEINRNEVFRLKYSNYIQSYCKQLSQKTICSNFHLLEQRLCTWLLMISDRNRKEELNLTQEDIARFLGAHRPCVSIIAGDLRKRGIINYIRSKVIINRSFLENLACDCYVPLPKTF